MTESEIMNALECLSGKIVSCRNCAYSKRFTLSKCKEQCAKDALDLINRKNAEIEDLKIKNEHLAVFHKEANAEIERLRKENALLEMKYTDRGAWYP